MPGVFASAPIPTIFESTSVTVPHESFLVEEGRHGVFAVESAHENHLVIFHQPNLRWPRSVTCSKSRS
jgi:hypothetical protein